jgi:hypothetical protein
VDDGECSERPAVLEYGRPAASKMASVFTRVGIFFVLGVVFFGFAILGGYVGHRVAPGPLFHFMWRVDLPQGTTAQNNPVVASALVRIRREDVIAAALRAAKVDGGETPAQLARRELLIFRAPDPNSLNARIFVAFEDRKAERSRLGSQALVAELDASLTSQGQAHFVKPLPSPGSSRDSDETQYVGVGVMIGLLLPAIALWMLWKPFSRIAASAAMSEAIWTQGPR